MWDSMASCETVMAGALGGNAVLRMLSVAVHVYL